MSVQDVLSAAKQYHIECADCLQWLPALPDGCVENVLTDPPYNVGIKYASTNDNRVDYEEWCREWFAELKRVCSGPILISCGIVNLGMWHRIEQPRWILSWCKPASSCRSPVGFNNWEPVLLYGSGWKRNGCDVLRTTEQASLPVQHTRNPIAHPCPKPVEWAVRQVEWFLKPGIILDPFLGSGTALVAAVQTGRRFLGCEIDETYFRVAEARLKAANCEDGLFAPPVEKQRDLFEESPS